MSQYKAETINRARNKIRLASDSLNEMNAFALEFDEGIDFAVMQLNKVINYLTAISKLESEKADA
jgi:hypothetical protein